MYLRRILLLFNQPLLKTLRETCYMYTFHKTFKCLLSLLTSTWTRLKNLVICIFPLECFLHVCIEWHSNLKTYESIKKTNIKMFNLKLESEKYAYSYSNFYLSQNFLRFIKMFKKRRELSHIYLYINIH